MRPVWRLFWFAGRARRREYWPVAVVTNIGIIAPSALSGMRATPAAGATVHVMLDATVAAAIIALLLVCLLLNLAVSARRLHDRGKSAWWLLVFHAAPWTGVLGAAVAYQSEGRLDVFGAASTVALLVFVWSLIELGMLQGVVGANRFGADPRGRVAADTFD